MTVFWQPKREFEPCGVVELASTGRSLKLTVEDVEAYVSVKDVMDVLGKRKKNAQVVRRVEVEPDNVRGDPGSLLTPEIKRQIKHEVYEMERQKKSGG